MASATPEVLPIWRTCHLDSSWLSSGVDSLSVLKTCLVLRNVTGASLAFTSQQNLCFTALSRHTELKVAISAAAQAHPWCARTALSQAVHSFMQFSGMLFRGEAHILGRGLRGSNVIEALAARSLKATETRSSPYKTRNPLNLSSIPFIAPIPQIDCDAIRIVYVHRLYLLKPL